MNEADLIATALAGLTPLGLKATLQKGNPRAAHPRADAFARIAKGKAHVDVVIEAKRNATPATAPHTPTMTAPATMRCFALHIRSSLEHSN